MQIAALCGVGALLNLVIREGSPAMGTLLPLGILTAVLFALAGPAGDLLRFLEELGDLTGVSRDLLSPLCKTCAMALVVRVGGDLCRDAGSSALGALLEGAGAVCAMLAALPLLRAVVNLLMELMK